jgi:hypothetical protein
MRRRAVLVMGKGERPHPWRSDRRGGVEDPADDSAVSEHVEVVVVPFTGWASRALA